MNTTSKPARLARLARTGALTTAAAMVHRVRKALTHADGAVALDAEHRAWKASRTTRALGEMKGLAMKVGQAAAYTNTGLAPEWREALSTLHQDAPSMDARTVSKVVVEELGQRAADLLAGFDSEPLAAASVGQVHRAVTPEGTPVAVKVQYPDASAALRADIDTLAALARGAAAVSKGGGGPGSPRERVEEFKERMAQETDYQREAANLQRFGDFYRNHPFIHVPGVHLELSTKRVLTMELVDGTRFAEALTWSQDERNLAGETIFRFFLHSLFRLGAFNADPHPGNYLFHGNGRVTFLDFGAIWESPSTVDEDLATVRSSALDGDHPQPDVAPEGRTARASSVWSSDQLSDDKGARRFDPDIVLPPSGAGWRHDAALEEIKARNAHVFSAMHNVGALLATLGAVCDWRRIVHEVWPRFSYPPSTALGKLDQKWMASLK